ncbi:MAG: hypothetical protein U9Q15_02090, partial [Patescibacteria group bacterium]|nr:hypothetical protein [Patescibacteria group bacterium]
ATNDLVYGVEGSAHIIDEEDFGMTVSSENISLFLNNNPEGSAVFTQWYKNNTHLVAYNNQVILDADLFDIGDYVYAVSWYEINSKRSNMLTSQFYKVDHSIPVISSVVLSPDPATTKSNLSVSVGAVDADGDTIQFRYAWLRNNNVISGQKSNVLSNSYFNAGDQIQVEVTPYDGIAFGAAKKSSALTIRSTSSSKSIYETDYTPPENITDIVLVSGENTITISWKDSVSDDFEGVYIYRSENNQNMGFIPYEFVEKGVEQFTDTNVAVNTVYHYKFVAKDTSGLNYQ